MAQFEKEIEMIKIFVQNTGETKRFEPDFERTIQEKWYNAIKNFNDKEEECYVRISKDVISQDPTQKIVGLHGIYVYADNWVQENQVLSFVNTV